MPKTQIQPHCHLPSYMYSSFCISTTMARKELKETLLATEGWIMVMGYICDIRSKHLGAGVYKVWAEKRN